MNLTRAFLLLLVITTSAGAQGQPLLYTVPFQSGDGVYRLYRIPAIWLAPNKPVMAFAEGRVATRRATGNIDIVLRRSFDAGQTWQPLQVIADLDADFCGNPCVVQDPTNGRLWLAFTRSRGIDTEEDIAAGKVPGTQVWIIHSDDDGATWSKPRDISASGRKSTWGWYGTGPGNGLYLASATSGRLLIPAYHSEAGVYRTHCLYSDDHGATWQLGGDAADHTSEPQVVVIGDQSLLMNARTISGHGNQRTLVTSRDGGTSWQPAIGLAALPDRGCQGCIYRCFRSGSQGHYDLIYTQPNDPNRLSVHAWISEDGGRSWPFAQELWHGPSAYTTMLRMQDGLIAALIECGEKDIYQQIAFVKFAPEWLKARNAPDAK